jgi:hypothetical protein
MPCYGLGVGSMLQITIGAEVDEPGNAKCGYTFDVTESEVIVGTVVSTGAAADSECTVGVANFGSVNGWTWSDGTVGAGQAYPDILAGDYTASRGSCTGKLELTLTPQVSNPFEAADAGGPPPAVLSRNWVALPGNSAGCPSACADDFYVTLQKL